MTELSDYLKSVTELPDDVLLGRIVMFTITDNPIEHADITSWFASLGLNPRFIPPKNRPIDSFKKATSEVDKWEYGLPKENTGILLTRKVTTDQEMVCRYVVREVRDSARRRLTHSKVIEAVFYKGVVRSGKVQAGSERIRIQRDDNGLDPIEIPDVDKAIQHIVDRYEYHNKYVDGQKIRAIVRTYLRHLNAIEIKGGVYFIHKSRTQELNKLCEFVNRCGPGCRMDQIPLVDMDNERDMIVEAFQREAEESLTDLVKEIVHVKSTRQSITPKSYASLKQKYDRVMDQAMEYQRTLKLTQFRTSTAAELALDSLADLQSRLLGGS